MTDRQAPPQRRWLLWVVVLILGVLFVWATKGPPSPEVAPAAGFAFAALGDAPYYPWEEIRYRQTLQDINAHDVRMVLHVGDAFWRPCSDAMYERARGWMQSLRHPVVYTPGDNEWADCWEPRVGAYVPLDRLARLRAVFFEDPGQSLGGTPRPLVSQASRPDHAEFVEHARWTDDGVVFSAVHLIGGWNGRTEFPGRTAADDEESIRRTEAATAWLRETFEQAHDTSAPAVVLAFHANPGFEEPPDEDYRRSYEPFIEVLEEEVFRFAKPVLMVHGDDHDFLVDAPLTRRSTGVRLDNLTRLQVPGSPDVGWVRVVVHTGAPVTFSFQARVVPFWKYW